MVGASGRRPAIAVVGLVVSVALIVGAVLLWRSGMHTSTYPPLEVDDRAVAGPYQLTRYDGSHIAGASALALAALLSLAWSVRALVTTRR